MQVMEQQGREFTEIIFVDDDELILRTVQRAGHRRAETWQVLAAKDIHSLVTT